MRVHLPGTGGMTMVENTFIDQFMPAASGDFVKIYLYLLRCVQDGQTDVTVSQVADALNYTEADVKRAMGYWQRMQMLDYDGDDHTQSGAAVDPARSASQSAPAALDDTAVEKPDTAAAGGKITEFRPAQPQKTPSREELRSLIFVAENGQRSDRLSAGVLHLE